MGIIWKIDLYHYAASLLNFTSLVTLLPPFMPKSAKSWKTGRGSLLHGALVSCIIWTSFAKVFVNIWILLSRHYHPRSSVCVTGEDVLSGILCKSNSPVICYRPPMMICQVKRVCDNGKLSVGIRIKLWSRLCVKICIKPPPPLARVTPVSWSSLVTVSCSAVTTH